MAAPSPVQSSPPSSLSASDSSCMQRWPCLFAGWRERESIGKKRVSKAIQSHRGQPVVSLVYTVAVHSQSTHRICSNTAISNLTMGSNTPPTDSTDLRVTTQFVCLFVCYTCSINLVLHKSGVTTLPASTFLSFPLLWCKYHWQANTHYQTGR